MDFCLFLLETCRNPGPELSGHSPLQDRAFTPWLTAVHVVFPNSPSSATTYGAACSGFPCGSAGKESPCNARDLGSIPGLGRSPGEGNDYPLVYSYLENSMDCIVHEVAKSCLFNFRKIEKYSCAHSSNRHPANSKNKEKKKRTTLICHILPISMV